MRGQTTESVPSRTARIGRAILFAIGSAIAIFILLLGYGMRRNENDIDRQLGTIIYVLAVAVICWGVSRVRTLPTPRQHHAVVLAILLLVAAFMNVGVVIAVERLGGWTLVPTKSPIPALAVALASAISALGLALDTRWGKISGRGVVLIYALSGPLGLTLAVFGWWATRKQTPVNDEGDSLLFDA